MTLESNLLYKVTRRVPCDPLQVEEADGEPHHQQVFEGRVELQVQGTVCLTVCLLFVCLEVDGEWVGKC